VAVALTTHKRSECIRSTPQSMQHDCRVQLSCIARNTDSTHKSTTQPPWTVHKLTYTCQSRETNTSQEPLEPLRSTVADMIANSASVVNEHGADTPVPSARTHDRLKPYHDTRRGMAPLAPCTHHCHRTITVISHHSHLLLASLRAHSRALSALSNHAYEDGT